MIIPVRCFTCGKVIGDMYRAYKEEVRKRRIAQGIQTNKVEYLTKEFNDKTIEGEVLDDFKLTKYCCRRHMLTHVDII